VDTAKMILLMVKFEQVDGSGLGESIVSLSLVIKTIEVRGNA
jgi:hypothetical protein